MCTPADVCVPRADKGQENEIVILSYRAVEINFWLHPEGCCQEQQGRGIAAHILIPKYKEQSPLDSVANLHSLNESSLLNGYESASWKCDFLLMYAYSTNCAVTDYCYKWLQSKEMKNAKDFT